MRRSSAAPRQPSTPTPPTSSDPRRAPRPAGRARRGAAPGARAVGRQRPPDAGRDLDAVCAAPAADLAGPRARRTTRRLSRQRIDEPLARQLTEAASLGTWSTDDGNDPWYARIATPDDAVRTQDVTGHLGQGRLDEVHEDEFVDKINPFFFFFFSARAMLGKRRPIVRLHRTGQLSSCTTRPEARLPNARPRVTTS